MIIKSYHRFIINENLQKARSVINRLNIPETNPDFIKLRNLLEDNLGYIGKFTEWLFIDKVPIQQLVNLYNLITVNNLPKPIDEFDRPEEIIDLFIRSTSKSDLNQMISVIPSRTREHLMGLDNWGNFIRFLTQNRNKKNIIIDFLSKKSARYGNQTNEEENDHNGLDNLIQDIEKLLNSPPIESIKIDSLRGDNINKYSGMVSRQKNHIYFIFENNKYLIVCVDYAGIKKYGSRYWCITQNEDTFNSYINSKAEESNLQLILYDKTKRIYIDEHSVMGITMTIDKRVSAAFWEDDEECSDEASRIIKEINITMEKFYEVYKNFYGKRKASRMFYEHKELYIGFLNNVIDSKDEKKIHDILINFLNQSDFNDFFKHSTSLHFSPRHTLYYDVESLYSDVESLYSVYDLDIISESNFFVDYCKKLKEVGLKTNVPLKFYEMIYLLDKTRNFKTNIFEISKFQKSWFDQTPDVFDIISKSDIRSEKLKYLIDYLFEHNYDIGKAIYLLNEKDDNYLTHSIKSRLIKTGYFEVNKRGTVRIIKKDI